MKIYGKRRWIVLALCMLAFMLLASNLSHLAPFDNSVYGVIAFFHNGFMSKLAIVLTNLVHPVILLIVGFSVLFFLKKREYVVPFFANLAIPVMLHSGLKAIFVRTRPDSVVRVISQAGYSFPSGHAMTAAAFYGFMIYLVQKFTISKHVKNTLSAVMVLVILLVGMSRIYLGVHFASDVLASFLLATSYLIVFISFVDRYFAQREYSVTADLQVNKNGSLITSFAHALDGIISCLRAERNMIIHFAVMTMTGVFGFVLRISAMEWAVCLILFAAVIASELFNTALETIVDICSPEWSSKAKLAKDTAAGAVLVIALSAFAIGLMIFVPKLITVIAHEL